MLSEFGDRLCVAVCGDGARLPGQLQHSHAPDLVRMNLKQPDLLVLAGFGLVGKCSNCLGILEAIPTRRGETPRDSARDRRRP